MTNLCTPAGNAIQDLRQKTTAEITHAMCQAAHHFAGKGHKGATLMRNVTTALGSNQIPSAILTLYCAWIERSMVGGK